jgi:hypothetical protein
MQQRATRQPGGHMARIALRAEIHMARILQRHPAEDRDAVIALLPSRHRMAVTQLGEHLVGDFLGR